MKIRITYISTLLVTILLSSCTKDWLSAKADKTLIVPETLDDFQSMLDNVTLMNQQFPSLGEIASDDYYVTDPVYLSSLKSANTDSYIWTKTLSHLKVSAWNQQYAKILIDNIILEGVNKIRIDELNKYDFNNIKGQAHFNRAYTLFTLSETFARKFDSQNSDKTPGIVLRLSTDIESPSRRRTVKECYEQILNDLSIAKNSLPNSPIVQTRASRTAVFALLAKIFLVMEDYEKSYSAADSCLKMYSDLLDFNNIPTASTNLGRFNKEVIYHTNFTISPFTSSALIYDSLFSKYEEADLRKTRFFRKNANGTISFKGNYESQAGLLFCGLSTDEVYLIRAECNARLGRTIDAMNDLNTLLINRFEKGKFTPLTATSTESALKKILTERRKELIFRNVRWSDLRRLNKDPNFSITLKRTVAGKEYFLEPNSPKYTFPIPDDIVDATGISQNAGWAD